MGDLSAIITDLAVDDPIVIDSEYEFDEHDRRYIDNQILGIETHLVNALLRGVTGTYALVDGSSPALASGSEWRPAPHGTSRMEARGRS